MTTLVISPRHSEDSDAIEDAAIRVGWSVRRLENWGAPDDLIGMDNLAFYGEALFVRVIADQCAYTLLEATPGWLANLPYAYKQRRIDLMSLGEAHKLTSPAFIKPAGDKAFPSKIYASGSELEAITQDIATSINVLVSEFIKWEVEYRCFVLGREIKTFSAYLQGGVITRKADGKWPIPKYDNQALEFASKVVSDPSVDTPPAFVLDVGIIEGRGWAVLEANPAWASGIYGCDAARILDVLREACIHPDHLNEANQKWVSVLESWD